MKSAFIILLLSVSTLAFGQDKKIDTLNFCNINYKVPGGCNVDSKFSFACSDYSMAWINMTTDQFNSKAAEQYIDQMSGSLKGFKKVTMTVYVLKKQFTGYEITYKNDDGSNGYQVVAYGIVNNQPVLIQLSLKERPKSNDDIPEFAQQIITIVPNS